MTGVLRSWACQNSRCGTEFDAWESYPTCPECGNVRVAWIPGGGHVMGTAAAADAELRMMADNYGLSDLRSAKRDERAKPYLPTSPASPGRQAENVQFAAGFTSPVLRDANGIPVASCLPSTSNVNFKAKVPIGKAMSKSRTIPGANALSTIEASHRPPK